MAGSHGPRDFVRASATAQVFIVPAHERAWTAFACSSVGFAVSCSTSAGCTIADRSIAAGGVAMSSGSGTFARLVLAIRRASSAGSITATMCARGESESAPAHDW